MHSLLRMLIPATCSVVLLSQSATASRNSLEIAEDYGECPVCMEVLFKKAHEHGSPPTVFTEKGKRSCRHLLCQDCATEISEASSEPACPICRTSFSGCVPIPDPFGDFEGWFAIVDYNSNGNLSAQEITDALYFPVEPESLEHALRKHFRVWDEDRNTTLSYEESKEHLRPYLEMIRDKVWDKLMRNYDDIPDWRTEPSKWFHFWDYDRSKELERSEVLRALAKTLHRFGIQPVAICDLLDALWATFDTDPSPAAGGWKCPLCTYLNADNDSCSMCGTPRPKTDDTKSSAISEAEFMKKGGLHEMLRANIPAQD